MTRRIAHGGVGHVMMALVFWWCLATVALAAHEVRQPNGELVERSNDLQVKIRGGELLVQRTWQADNVTSGEYRWHLNPAWDDLRFEYDPLDGSVSEVLRAGSRFERTGDGVYVFDDQFFIRREADGWRWHDRRGEWIRYDDDGRILSYGNANLTIASFTRDGQQRVQSIRDYRDEVQLTYSYDGERIRRVTDRTGRYVQYTWSGDQLREVRDVLGHVWRYDYAGGLLVKVTDPEDRSREFVYSGKRVWKVIDAEAAETTYEYDYNRARREYVVVERTPEGVRRETRYDVKGRVAQRGIGDRQSMRLLRDGAHVEVRVDARGLRTRTEYDAHRNPVLIRHPDGTEVRMRYESQHNRLVERIDEAGYKTTWAYDSRGNVSRLVEAVGEPEQRVTEYAYTNWGERRRRTVKGASEAEDATTTWEYDEYGNVRSEINPLNEAVTYTHNLMGQVLTGTNAEDETTRWEYNDAGWLVAQRDGLNNVTVFEHDKVGNRTLVRDAEDNETLLTYLPTNRLETVTDGDGGVTTYRYDKDGRRTHEIDGEGVTIETRYDAEGRVSLRVDGAGFETGYRYGADGSVSAGLLIAVDHPTFSEEYRHDERGRRVRLIRVLPATVQAPERREITVNGYDGRGLKTSETSPGTQSFPDGRVTSYRYDGLRRLVEARDPTNGRTRYTYDARNNLLTLTDAKDQEHRFEYDLADRVQVEMRPLGQAIEFDYDRAARLSERRAPAGEKRTYEYDASGRLEREQHFHPGAVDPAQSITYQYNDAGRLKGYVQTGESKSQASYTLNARGQRLQEQVTYGVGPTSVSFIVGAGFGDNGRKTSQTYPGGTAVEFSYDPDTGRLVGQSLPGGGDISYTEHSWTQPTRVVGPGFERTITLDALQRPERIQVMGSQGVVMDYAYRYDAVGNILERETEDGVYSYRYDALDRLVEAVPPVPLQRGPDNPNGLPVEAYDYDAVHNRIASAHQPGSWDYDANNRLEAWGSGAARIEIEYDDNGQTVAETRGSVRTEYAYGAAERLLEVRRSGALVSRYRYDPFGRRIAKEVVGLGTTWFVYAEEGLLAELDASGAAKRIYGYMPGTMWGTSPVHQSERIGTEWETHALHVDHLGTPKRATDAGGARSWEVRAEAFGKALISAPSSINVSLRLPGQYFDAETGLAFNLNRNYDSSIGRYRESDPLGLYDGVNVFQYASNSPLIYADPYGLARWRGSVVSGGAGHDVSSRRLPIKLPVGVSFYAFDLCSECMDGEAWCVQIDAWAAGLSFGLPVSITEGEVEIEDGSDRPNPLFASHSGGDLFGFKVASLGYAAGEGKGCAAFQIGLGISNYGSLGGMDCGSQKGLDLSINSASGQASIRQGNPRRIDLGDCGACDGWNTAKGF